MNISTSTRILLCSAALSCGGLAQDKASVTPAPTTAKGPAEDVKSTLISEFQCREEPLDSVLARLSKLSGVELRINKDSFKGRPLPTVSLPTVKGFRLEDVLNTVTAVSGTKWLVTGPRVEVSTQ